jgi:hypothetical protein
MLAALLRTCLTTAAAAGSSCPFHLHGHEIGGGPHDPNALFQWRGQWHMMWQSNGGWGHAISGDLAHWSKLKDLAIAGPNAWDGSLTILDGKPVALFDCTDPARDRPGHLRSCSGLNTTNNTVAAGSSEQQQQQQEKEGQAGETERMVGATTAIGDPSFIGIARPADLADVNLTTWVKDPTAPITFLNETGRKAAGYSGPSPIWTTDDGVLNLVQTYGAGHTGLFCCTDPTLRRWEVCNPMFYPDRDAGGAMFLPLPGPPKLQERQRQQQEAAADRIPYTHMIFGVTPGLGKGVAALGIYNATARTFSNSTGPPPTAGLLPVGTMMRGGGRSSQSSHRYQGQLGSGSTGCIACGEDPEGGPICCSDLAAGYHKETYDAGDVKFGQAWVDPHTKRMLWFAWAGLNDLSVVREITYEPKTQQLLMYPVPELKVLRSPSPLGTLPHQTSLPMHWRAAAGSPPPPTAHYVPLFTSNDTAFDVEVSLALPSSGGATSFVAAIMVQRPPSTADAAAAAAPGNASAVLTVNISAVAADHSRFVSMSVYSASYMEHCAPRCKGFIQTHTIDYNFTLPAPRAAGGSEPPQMGVRILVDSTLVEAFVAGGRGAITIPTSTPPGGSAGVYLLGGGALIEGALAAVVNKASAWAMCMQ